MAPVAIITLCQCRFITKAAADNTEIEINGCDCIPIKLSLLTLEVELHIIFTELEYYSNFTFFSAIKNVKTTKKISALGPYPNRWQARFGVLAIADWLLT